MMMNALKVLLLVGIIFTALNINAKDFGYDQPYNKLRGELVTPHIPFCNPYYKNKIKVLVIAPTWTQRETVELAQRISVDYIPLMTEAFYSFGPYEGDPSYMGIDPADFKNLVDSRLGKDQDYDVIIIGKIQWNTFPEEIRKKIIKKVQQGTGLVYIAPSKLDKDLTDKIKWDSSFKLKGVPLKVIPKLKDIPEQTLIKSGNLDKGRIVFIDYGEQDLKKGELNYMLESLTPSRSDDVLFYDYYYSLIGKAVLWASDKDPDIKISDLNGMPEKIKQAETAGRKIKVTLDTGNRIPSKAKMIFQVVVRDRNNTIEFMDMGILKGNNIEISLPFLKGGEKILDVWVRDEYAKVIDWFSTAFDVIPEIGIKQVSMKKDVFNKGEKIEGNITLSQKPQNDNLKFNLEVWDGHDRKIVSKTIKADNENTSFSFNVDSPLTSKNKLKISLLDNNKIIDDTLIPLFIKTVDTKKLVRDFSFLMWAGAGANRRSAETFLQQFKKYGVNMVLLGQFSWNKPMGDTADVNKQLAANDILAAPYLCRLFFVCDRYDHLKPIKGKDGPEIRKCTMSNPQANKRLMTHLSNTAAKLSPLGAAFYNLGDENCIGMGYDVCFCPKCQESFRKYLKKIYPDLAALNKQWGTDYKNWQDVKPIELKEAAKTGRYSQWIDHRMHMDKLFVDYHVACVDTIQKADPGAKVGIEGPVYPSKSFSGFNLYQMLKNFQYFGPYNHLPEIHAFSFMTPESFRSMWFGSYRGRTFEGAMRYSPWYSLFEGMNTAAWWTSGLGESRGLGGAAAFTPDYSPLKNFEWAAEEIQEIQSGIGKLLLNSKRENSPIGIYFSNACLHASTLRSKESTWESSIKDFDNVLRDGGFEYQFITPEMVKKGLSDYCRVLILPFSQAISPDEVKKMKQFVKQGGILIADFSPAIMDGHGKLLGKSALQDVFGKFNRLNINTYGKGKAIYLADYVKGYYNKRKSAKAKGICTGLKRLLEGTGKVTPFAQIEDINESPRQDVEASMFKNGDALYLALLRGYVKKKTTVKTTGAEGEAVGGTSGEGGPEVKIGLDKPYHIYEIRNGKYLGNKKDVIINLEPSQSEILALLPAKIDGLNTNLDKTTYKPGEKVIVSGKILPDALKSSGLCVRLNVIGPTGKELPYYFQKLLTENGTFKGEIALSLNECPGKYTIIVEDVVSGLDAKKTFSIQ